MSCRCIYELLTMNGKGVSSEPQYYLLKWQTPHSNIKTFIQILHQVCFAGCFFNPVCCLVTSLRLSLNYKLILSSDHGTPAQWDIRGSQLSFIDLPASPTGFTVSFKENRIFCIICLCPRLSCCFLQTLFSLVSFVHSSCCYLYEDHEESFH